MCIYDRILLILSAILMFCMIAASTLVVAFAGGSAFELSPLPVIVLLGVTAIEDLCVVVLTVDAVKCYVEGRTSVSSDND